MRCPKCKKQLRKGAKFCPACGAKVEKHIGRRVFVGFLIVLLLLGTIAGGLAIGFSAGNLFGKTRPAPTINNVEEAIATAKEMGKELGYENAMSEMTEKVTTEIDGDCYYRLQQNYKGIPVYGRTAVYVSDEGGNVTSITGNIMDVNAGVDLTPTITQAQVISAVQAYCAKTLGVEIIEEIEVEELQYQDLYIYISDNGTKSHLVYRVHVGWLEFLVDAHNAEVLFYDSLLRSDTVTGSLQGQLRKYDKIAYVQEKGISYLKDSDKKIEVYNIINSSENLYNYNYNIWNYFKKINVWNDEEILTWSQNDSPSTAAVDAYVNTQIAYKYFEEVLKNVSVDGRGGAEISILVGVEYVKDEDGKIENWTENALSGTEIDEDGIPKTQLFFNAENEEYISYAAFLDIVAHEYMHAVEKLHSGMVGGGECGAIKEGLSDIFGEMVESWYCEKDPDWIHTGSKERNLRDPGSQKQPSAMNDKFWKNPKKLRIDNGYVHHNSTVISHAAYLMWNGIDDNANKKISTDDLAKLWYRAMLMMPSDCDFATCRQMVEWAASSVSGLTDAQRKCIAEAFDMVGIQNQTLPPEILINCDWNVYPDSYLKVYNVEGNLHSSYTLTISGTCAEHELAYAPTVLTDIGFRYDKTVEITKASSYQLDLPDGYYTFTITDRNNPKYTYSFTVSVSNQGTRDTIELHTDFENQLIVKVTEPPAGDAYRIYQDAARKTTNSGAWSERLNLTADMAISNGSAKTKTKMTMTSNADISNYSESDPSRVYMSGTAEMSVMGQTYAWNVQYENGTAHYQYTQPTQTSADLAIDPSFFNFETMTSDMMTKAKVSGNQITFTVPRDKITEVGIAAVNQMSGVENLKYGDVDVSVTIGSDGTIDTITMVFHASLKYQGYDADVDYNIDYHFSQGTTISNQLPPQKQTFTISQELPEMFFCITSSSNARWEFVLQNGGSFDSSLAIYNFGESGEGYPLGTGYISKTSGKLTNLEKINDTTYRMVVEQCEYTGQMGDTYIADDTRYIFENINSFCPEDVFYLYLPGTPRSELPQGLVDSVNNNGRYGMNDITPSSYILYHPCPESVGFELVFIGELDSARVQGSVRPIEAEKTFDIASTMGYTKAWEFHDRSGTEHLVTDLAFQEDGTFCGCVGIYLSEWIAAFTGTYEVKGNELILHYTFNGEEKITSYQVNWDDRIFKQASDENLVIPHQAGSEYHFEENTDFTADELFHQVDLFQRYLQNGWDEWD